MHPLLVYFFLLAKYKLDEIGDYKMDSEFLIIKAEEDGVQVIGLTRGESTKFHHSEKLDEGELLIVQFTEHTSAIKIKGKATVQSRHGEIESFNSSEY